jgi:hypothetical protein
MASVRSSCRSSSGTGTSGIEIILAIDDRARDHKGWPCNTESSVETGELRAALERRARAIWKEIASSNENEGMGADTYEESLVVSNEQLKQCGLETVDYALVNIYPDEVATESFQHAFHSHQYAYVRLVLEKLVEGPSARSILIDIRTDLDAAHKLDLDSTDKAFEKFLDEKWIEESESRRGSMSTKVALAPRAYMELSYLLVDQFGMDKDDLPQQIYHRL